MDTPVPAVVLQSRFPTIPAAVVSLVAEVSLVVAAPVVAVALVVVKPFVEE